MSFFCPDFHQSVFSVLFVQVEGLPDNQRGPACTEKKTDVGTRPGHVQNHDQNKYSQKSACEDEQVLRLESPELDGSPDAFVDVVSNHRAGLKEEGAKDSCRDNKKDTGTEPARRGF